MAKKHAYSDFSEEIEDGGYADKKEEKFPVPTEIKKSGVVIRIIKGKSILIRYGNDLGAKIPYTENEHKNLKEGDPISFF